MAKRRSLICQSLLTFFGLTPDYRPQLFSIIHEIVYHGKGGYDWYTVYNMPIWLRTFTYNKIGNFLEQQQEEQEKAMRESQGIQQLAPNNSQITPPDYIAKAPRK